MEGYLGIGKAMKESEYSFGYMELSSQNHKYSSVARQVPGDCEHCLKGLESVEHILKGCSKAAIIWYKILLSHEFFPLFG